MVTNAFSVFTFQMEPVCQKLNKFQRQIVFLDLGEHQII